MKNRILSGMGLIAGVLIVGIPTSIWADLMPEQARRKLKERLATSKIHLTQGWQLGKVHQVGTALVLLRDGVPARAFNTLAQEKPYPKVWHLDDYGRVDIVDGDAVVKTPEEKAFAYLKRGEVLVIVDHKFKGNTIELWTHTLKPIQHKDSDDEEADAKSAPADTTAKYASTKFVFHFPEEVLRSGDVAGIERQINEWLKPFESEWDAREFSRGIVSSQ